MNTFEDFNQTPLGSMSLGWPKPSQSTKNKTKKQTPDISRSNRRFNKTTEVVWIVGHRKTEKREVV